MSNLIVDYAVLSDAVYSRNKLDQAMDPVDDFGYANLTVGNPEVYAVPDTDKLTGFYAETFVKGGQIVIAFRGTDFNDLFDKDWNQGNIPLAAGDQEAAEWQPDGSGCIELGEGVSNIFGDRLQPAFDMLAHFCLRRFRVATLYGFQNALVRLCRNGVRSAFRAQCLQIYQPDIMDAAVHVFQHPRHFRIA